MEGWPRGPLPQMKPWPKQQWPPPSHSWSWRGKTRTLHWASACNLGPPERSSRRRSRFRRMRPGWWRWRWWCRPWWGKWRWRHGVHVWSNSSWLLTWSTFQRSSLKLRRLCVSPFWSMSFSSTLFHIHLLLPYSLSLSLSMCDQWSQRTKLINWYIVAGDI